jgi:hypothetical protein
MKRWNIYVFECEWCNLKKQYAQKNLKVSNTLVWYIVIVGWIINQNIKSLDNVVWNQKLDFQHVSTSKKMKKNYN